MLAKKLIHFIFFRYHEVLVGKKHLNHTNRLHFNCKSKTNTIRKRGEKNIKCTSNK